MNPSEEMLLVAWKAMQRILLRVSWDTCKIQRGLLPAESMFSATIEKAAEDLKQLGHGWEEYT